MLTPTVDLLERESELGRLAARVDAAVARKGSVVALEGEAGIGKSALLAWTVQRATAAGMLVLSARAGELEQDFGYGVVRQLFDGPLVEMEPQERALMLGGAAGLAASALSFADEIASRPAEPGSVLHGLYWLSANLATARPVLICIDDAHWADSASIAFLGYLARRVEGLALLVVYATRMAEDPASSCPPQQNPTWSPTCCARACSASARRSS